MDRAANAVSANHPDLYLRSPPIRRLTTGLARGTDDIGAGVALRQGWQLQSVLAFDRERFADLAIAGCPADVAAAYRARYADFIEKSSSVLEILGNENGGLRRDAYELVGEITLEQADVLIGVWDNNPARGLGGCAHLMRLARERGLPVAWIHATQPEPIKVYLPGSDAAVGVDALEEWLVKSLCLQATPAQAHAADRDAQRRWSDFVAEDGERASRFFPFYQHLLVLGGKKGRPRWLLPASTSEDNWRDNWRQFRTAVEATDPTAAAAMDDALWRPFLRADHLAERYGRAYRGAYVLIYLLASLATLIGLSSLIFHDAKLWLVLAELIVILVMMGMTYVGRRHHWHERWLEYRAVAEQLRQARMGVWTGQSLEPSDAEGDSNHPGASWTSWYVRACVRQMPMIRARATPDYLRHAIATIDALEIGDQQRFNERTSQVQDRVHERLEHIEEKWLLRPLIVACALFLVVYWSGFAGFRDEFDAGTLICNGRWTAHLPDWMTLIGALLPAVGAALLGVRSQGDFSAYAERSADTAAQLRPIAAAAARWRAADGGNPGFEDLLDLTDRTTEALANDVFAWRMVYRRKALTVSA